jgi:hypothetical protein
MKDMIMAITGNRDKINFSPAPDNGLNEASITPGKICLLQNNVEYFLKYVFIFVEEIGFRLVVIHQEYVKTDTVYKSLKSAKIAFARMYNRKSWKKGVKPTWSHFNQPDKKWLADKITILEKNKEMRGKT